MLCCVQAARSSQQNGREKQTFFPFLTKLISLSFKKCILTQPENLKLLIQT
jgi:hypothetical protein